MRDPVDDLPAEFQTPSLRSLPGDLKAKAVQVIIKKFGLKRDIEPAPKWDKKRVAEIIKKSGPNNHNELKAGDRVKVVASQGFIDHTRNIGKFARVDWVEDNGDIRIEYTRDGDSSVFFADSFPRPQDCLERVYG